MTPLVAEIRLSLQASPLLLRYSEPGSLCCRLVELQRAQRLLRSVFSGCAVKLLLGDNMLVEM